MRDWSRGGYPAVTVVRGTESREGVSGWVTVFWAADASPDGLTCGSAQVATSCWHTDNANDVMYPTITSCTKSISDRERYHAAIA